MRSGAFTKRVPVPVHVGRAVLTESHRCDSRDCADVWKVIGMALSALRIYKYFSSLLAQWNIKVIAGFCIVGNCRHCRERVSEAGPNSHCKAFVSWGTYKCKWFAHGQSCLFVKEELERLSGSRDKRLPGGHWPFCCELWIAILTGNAWCSKIQQKYWHNHYVRPCRRNVAVFQWDHFVHFWHRSLICHCSVDGSSLLTVSDIYSPSFLQCWYKYHWNLI